MHTFALAALLCAPPADETVTVVNMDAIALKDAERLDGKPVVATFTVGAASYTWGAGKSLITVTGPRASAREARGPPDGQPAVRHRPGRAGDGGRHAAGNPPPGLDHRQHYLRRVHRNPRH